MVLITWHETHVRERCRSTLAGTEGRPVTPYPDYSKETSMFNRRIVTTLTTTAVVLGATLLTAPPAAAGELVYSNGGPGHCFTVRKQRDAIGAAQVTVWNTCGDHRRVKVIWKYGPDSGCNTTWAGDRKFSDSSAVQAKFDKLVTC